jgi:predicted nucleotidyltransferase
VSQSPSLARIASVARALGKLSPNVVFIGGAIAPLLQTERVIPSVRPTSDVDAVIATTHYADYERIEGELRTLQFKQDTTANHAHRWIAPDGTPFDLVPAGSHLGATANPWDQLAIETAVEATLEGGIVIRHASAPGFLALKWAAFRDRGIEAPFASSDLEDILALLVSRKPIVDEVRLAPSQIRQEVVEGLKWLTKSPDKEDLIAAHLGNVQDFTRIRASLQKRVEGILHSD